MHALSEERCASGTQARGIALIFGKFLMGTTAFVTLEDIAHPEPEEELPANPLAFPPPMVEAPPPTLVHSTYKPKQKRSSLWPTGHDEKGQMLLFA